MRIPDGYRTDSERSQKKWNRILSFFFEDKLDELIANQRTGVRGRILSALVLKIFDIIGVQYKAEPIFTEIDSSPFYKVFAMNNDIKLRTHQFYNPDILLEDGTWIEITLSENTAYKKLFRYGHQADSLLVLWLDEDDGYHKEMCKSVEFPNAEVVCVDSLYKQIDNSQEGRKLIEQMMLLKKMKGTIL